MGYPAFELGGGELGEAYAGFAGRHFGHQVDPGQVLATVDVTAGVRLALEVLGADRSPMVLPLPAYSPQLGLAEVTDREQRDLPVTADGDAHVLAGSPLATSPERLTEVVRRMGAALER